MLKKLKPLSMQNHINLVKYIKIGNIYFCTSIVLIHTIEVQKSDFEYAAT